MWISLIVQIIDLRTLHKAMAEKRVPESDAWGRLHKAKVLHLGEVRAVALETTGDISVLHGDNLDDVLLTGVDWNSRATK